MPKNKNIIEEAAPSTDEEEDNIVNDDICSQFELDKIFREKYKISDESAVTLQKDYVLSICNDGAWTRLASGLSNGSVQIFDINGERSLCHSEIECIQPPVDNQQALSICGVQFLDDYSPDCLLIGTTNGLVRLFDLRTQRVEAGFQENMATNLKDVESKKITCFARNANSRQLCTGTEKYQENVYLIFYDIRQRKQLGGYFLSHNEDVTSLSFHTSNPDLLCSGSTDGLINIYDIKENNEDDALLTTINTESSVDKLNWHKDINGKDVVSCLTHTDFKLYESEEADVIAEFKREDIAASIKRKDLINVNLINTHNMKEGGVFLLAGTNTKKGETLRSLSLQNKQLLPLADFEGNKQIIRASLYNSMNRALITAGESGIITLWTPQRFDQATSLASSHKLKAKTKLKSNKPTPY